MANCCWVSLLIKGEYLNIKKFLDNEILLKTEENKHSILKSLDRDFDETNVQAEKDGFCYLYFGGNVKWSVAASLRIGNSYGEKPLEEISKEYNLDIEYYSNESGLCFQEYALIKQGEVIADECKEWYEVYIAEYETYDEFMRDKANGWLYCKGYVTDYLIHNEYHTELKPLLSKKNKGVLKRVLKKIYKPLFEKAKEYGEDWFEMGGYPDWEFELEG